MTEALDQEIRTLRSLFWSERDPDGRAFAPLADAYLRAGETKEALELLTDGTTRHPDFSSGHVVATRLYLGQGMTSEAEISARRVLELDGENVVALEALAQVVEANGDTAEAARLASTLYELDPDAPGARAPETSFDDAGEPELGVPADSFAESLEEMTTEAGVGLDDPFGAGASAETMKFDFTSPDDEAPPAAPEMGLDALAPEPEVEPEMSLDALAPEPAAEPEMSLDALAPDAEPEPEMSLDALAPEPAAEPEMSLDALAPDAEPEPEMSLDALAPDAEPEPEMSLDALAPDPEPEPEMSFDALAPDPEPEPELSLDALAPDPEPEPEMSLDALAPDPEPEPEMSLDALAPDPEPEPEMSLDALAPDPEPEPEMSLDALAPDPEPEPEMSLDALAPDPEPEPEMSLDALAPDPAPSAPDSTAPVATRTLAELYVKQGFTDKALDVLYALRDENPGATDITDRIAELERGDVRGTPEPEPETTLDALAPDPDSEPAMGLDALAPDPEPEPEMSLDALAPDPDPVMGLDALAPDPEGGPVALDALAPEADGDEVETLARELAEGGADEHEVDTPFAWADEHPDHEPQPADDGPRIGDYFDSLLSWQPRDES